MWLQIQWWAIKCLDRHRNAVVVRVLLINGLAQYAFYPINGDYELMDYIPVWVIMFALGFGLGCLAGIYTYVKKMADVLQQIREILKDNYDPDDRYG